ncbi:MAG: AAA family ATPase [Candidatus Helarchaeota archaeon]
MKPEMKIFTLVGMPGAGKSEATKLIEDLGIPVIIMGDVIREEMRRNGIELTRENMGKFTREIREHLGWDIVAKKCVEKIKNIEADILIIDGVRNPEEIEYFKNNLEKFKVIYVKASPETRFQRLRARGRVDDPFTFDDFKKRDERELSFGIKKIMDQADYTIDNEHDREHLKAQILKIIS